MKRFGNLGRKVASILAVFHDGEELTAREIADRLKARGFDTTPSSVRYFIYWNMEHKHLSSRRAPKRIYYRPIALGG